MGKQTDTTAVWKINCEPIYQERKLVKIAPVNRKCFSECFHMSCSLTEKLINREFYKRVGYIEEEYDAPDGTRMIKLRKYKL